MWNANHGKGFLKEQAQSQKDPIREVSNLVHSREVLGASLHIPKEEHLKVYVEQV